MALKGKSQNRFYNKFDYEFFEMPRREDYRTPFQRDRDRIIYSSALRRLQAKTQVFLSGEYDFYRTRLTHSIEVAQIGRSICNYLKQKSPLLGQDFFIDPDLVEAVCLAHDLGHPPFGHSGESTLNRLMKDQGGFEGNAQTLRMLTKIIYDEGTQRMGMNPTRALMDGVMKYKSLMSQHDNPDRYFLYEDQLNERNFVFANHSLPEELSDPEKLNTFRSIECQIMDWADDTAYSLHDIIDGIHARLITRGELEEWAEEGELNQTESSLVETIINEMVDGNVERTFSRKIGDFINACQLEERENFLSPFTERYHYQLRVNAQISAEASLYKTIAEDIVFSSAQMQQLRFKWDHILEKLFWALTTNYIDKAFPDHKLLSEATHQMVIGKADPQQRIRILCDHIAGMTDGFAIRTYKRLFDPDFGSIADLV